MRFREVDDVIAVVLEGAIKYKVRYYLIEVKVLSTLLVGNWTPMLTVDDNMASLFCTIWF